MKEIIRDALYQFIEFHTTREIDKLDLKILADKFLEEKYKKEKKWLKQCLIYYT